MLYLQKIMGDHETRGLEQNSGACASPRPGPKTATVFTGPYLIIQNTSV